MPMKLTLIIFSILLSLNAFSQISAPVSCPQEALKIATAVAKATEVQSPWKSVSTERLRFIVTDPESHAAIFVNFARSELSTLNHDLTSCDSANKILWDSSLKFPPVDFFMGCFAGQALDNNQNQSNEEFKQWDALSSLCKTSKNPILILNSRLPADWKSVTKITGLSEDQLLIFTAFHEAFHNFQSEIYNHWVSLPVSKLFPGESRADYESVIDTCKNDTDFLKSFKADIEGWDRIIRTFPSLTDSELKTEAHLLIANRELVLSPCWERYNYRKEGVPQYFGAKLMIETGLATDQQMRVALASWLVPPAIQLNGITLSLDHALTQGRVDVSVFSYGIGAVMPWILERIDQSLSWQNEIDTQFTMEEALWSRVK
jgi:hypothetical protein